jgi:Tat protein translocase TatB subunit
MFGMGMGELLLILVVALLVVGPDKLPNAARAIGKGIRDFRKHTHDLQSTLEQDEKLGEAVRELKSALRDEPIRAPRPLPPRTPATPPPLPEPPVVSPAAGTIAKSEPPSTPAGTDPAAPPRAKADG